MNEDLNNAISRVESAIQNPRRGLPEQVFLFVSRMTPLINVDLLIQDEEGRTLLTWRDDEFYEPGWHIPGSIVRHKETLAARIEACAHDELGAQVEFDSPPLLVSETIRQQDTRGHFISLLYRCRLRTPPDESRRAGPRPLTAGEWQWHVFCPPNLLTIQKQYARFF